MRDIWLNPTRTSTWDSDPLSGNPLRGEQVDLLLSLIADHYIPGSTILDIGSGSGLVEEQLFKRLPDALVGNAAAALAFGGDHLDDLAAAGDKAGIGTPSRSSASTRNSGSGQFSG